MSDLKLSQIECDIKKCVSEIRLFTSGEAIATITAGKREAEKHGRPVSADDAEKITRLALRLKAAQKTEKALLKEEQMTKDRLQAIKTAAAKAEADLAAICDYTNGGATLDMFGLENSILRLKRELTSLSRTQDGLRATNDDLTKELESNLRALEAFKTLEDANLVATTTQRVKRVELEDLREEEATLNRIGFRKAQISAVACTDNVAEKVKLLESEKLFLLSKIKSKKEQMNINDRTLMAQGYHIADLLAKLETFTNSLKSNGLMLSSTRPGFSEDAEGVPVSLLDESIRIYRETQRTLKDREQQLTQIDTETESLECRNNILQRASQSAVRCAQFEQKDMELEYAHMQTIMQQRHEMYEDASTKLKDVQQSLKARLEKKGLKA